MPSRIIRESALTSRTLNALSHGAERLWWRLTIVADDYGRFDADPCVVRSRCFPLRPRLSQRQIVSWITELAGVAAIRVYNCDDHTYGAIVKWDKYQRAGRSKPKFPSPPDNGEVESAASRRNLPQPAASSGTESLFVSRDTRKYLSTTLSAPESIKTILTRVVR